MKKGGSGLINVDKIILNRKKQIYSINEPDKLLEFIHQNLAPKAIEKKTRGEVFTPMALVNEMLDTLPKDVWKNKDLKWLDPAAGIGNFPVAVYMRLMVSLSDVIRDTEQRKKHIIENMLYMVEINKKNVFLMKKIFCSTTYKLNVFEGSFIETEETKNKTVKLYKPEFMFDIVMGNPPYQLQTGPKTTIAIWNIFILNALKIAVINIPETSNNVQNEKRYMRKFDGL
jgi:type I restriction-modification system DNA methylase subunit